MIGYAAEWHARDKWQAAEGDRWEGRGQRNWQAYAARCRTWWESDGRPMVPWGKNGVSGPTAKPSVWEVKTRMDAIDAEIKTIQNRGFEDAMGWQPKCPEDRQRIKELKRTRAELSKQLCTS